MCYLDANNVPLYLWSLKDGIFGILKGSWGLCWYMPPYIMAWLVLKENINIQSPVLESMEPQPGKFLLRTRWSI